MNDCVFFFIIISSQYKFNGVHNICDQGYLQSYSICPANE